MPVTVKKASRHLKALERALFEQEKRRAETDLVPQVQTDITELLERTFGYWDVEPYRGAFKFGIPSLKWEKPNITGSPSQGVRIRFNCYVVAKGSGRLHVLWHWLTFGTNPYTFKKTVRFRLRNDNRTRPGSLDVDPFPGWNGWVTMPAGSTRRGIRPRGWYQLAIRTWVNEVGDLQGFEVISYSVKRGRF